MALSKRLQPGSQAGRYFGISDFQGFHPRQIALQRAGKVYRRPADVQKAFCETSRGHGGLQFVLLDTVVALVGMSIT